MELIKRIKAPTPKFWKKVRNAMITVGAVGGVLLAAPVSIPAGLVALGGYLVTIGAVGGTLSQLTKEDKTDEPR